MWKRENRALANEEKKKNCWTDEQKFVGKVALFLGFFFFLKRSAKDIFQLEYELKVSGLKSGVRVGFRCVQLVSFASIPLLVRGKVVI